MLNKNKAVNWPKGIELVFLPGLDGTGLSYRPLGEAMPGDTEATVVSYPTGLKLSYTELVQCAYEQVPHGKSMVIVAESFSGPIAISLASLFPSNIKGIIFCATFMKFPHSFLLGTTKYVPLALLLRRPAPDFLLSFVCGSEPFLNKLAPLFREIETLLNPEVMAHRIRMLRNIDATAHARTVSLPCCYIQATHDRIVSARCVMPFKELLSGIIVKTVDGPHGILQAKPEECAEIIVEFVNGLP